MQTMIESRTTDQLLVDLTHLETLPKTPETRMVGAKISDVITAREGIDDDLEEIFMDEEFTGTYLEAILIALATKPAWA